MDRLTRPVSFPFHLAAVAVALAAALAFALTTADAATPKCTPRNLAVIPITTAGFQEPTADESALMLNLLDSYLSGLVGYPCGRDVVSVPKADLSGFDRFQGVLSEEGEGLNSWDKDGAINQLEGLLQRSDQWGEDDLPRLMRLAEEEFAYVNSQLGSREDTEEAVNTFLLAYFGDTAVNLEQLPEPLQDVFLLSVGKNPHRDYDDLRGVLSGRWRPERRWIHTSDRIADDVPRPLDG